MTKANRKDLLFAAGLIGLVVAGYTLQVFIWPRAVTFGLIPRTARGLLGILTMPFLHSGTPHLLGNLSGLAVLLGFVFAFHPRRMAGVVIRTILLGGILLWLFGRPEIHVGASGLIYGLAGFIMVSGIVQRRFLPVVAALGVAVMYGGSLYSGLIPVDPRISWDGHLSGGLAGALVGRNAGRRR